MSTTELVLLPFYDIQTKSSSVKIEIAYPLEVSNLSYNFQLYLNIYIQNLLPKISYNQVHEAKYFIPKNLIVFNQLQPGKMYKVEIKWIKKGNSPKQTLNETKTLFFCSEKQPENEDHMQVSSDLPAQSYGQFVKNKIHNYFDQYYPQNSNEKQSENSHSLMSSNCYENQSQHCNNLTDIRKVSKSKQKTKPTFCNSESLIKIIGQNDPFINKKNLEKYILEGRKTTSIKDYLATKDLQCFNSYNKVYKNQTQRRKNVEKTLLVAKSINMFGQIYAFDQQFDTGVVNSSESANQKMKGKQFFKNDWFMGPFYSYDVNEKQMKRKNISRIQ